MLVCIRCAQAFVAASCQARSLGLTAARADRGDRSIRFARLQGALDDGDRTELSFTFHNTGPLFRASWVQREKGSHNEK